MAKPVITDKPVIDQAEFNGVTIWRKEGGSIEVSDTNYPSMKAALQDIAAKAGIKLEEGWNTQYMGWYIIQQLNERGNGSTSQQSAAPKSPDSKETQAAKQEGELKQNKFVEDKELTKRVEGSSADIAGARVRVYGKAQNRTALGIMHAYMTMYPQAKMEDLKKAFPDSLNPNSGPNVNFVYLEDKGPDPSNSWDWKFFKKEDELLVMGDGRKVGVVNTWTKDSFERLASWARQYGIVIADFEAVGKGGEKGGFRLEYLNGYVPPKAKKGIPAWIWIIIALLLIGALALLFCGPKKTVEKVVTETVVVHDTLYVKQIEEIEKNFNAAEFVAGKADLSDDAKFVLHDLAKVMQKNPQLKLRLEGHTSAEGDPGFNQKLSEARAAAAVAFLIEHEGIDASRLQAVGYGASCLKNVENPFASENRRTEFVVVE